MNGIRASVLTTALLPFVLALNASGQQSSSQARSEKDPSFERGRATLRAVARAIGECQESVESETKWGKRTMEIERLYIGPTKNVVWDIVPNKSVRSPYMGYIEFSASHRLWVPPETRSAHDRTHDFFFHHLFDSYDRNFRYEFDVGPNGIEFTGAHYRTADQAPRWFDLGRTDLCWDNLARNTRAAATESTPDESHVEPALTNTPQPPADGLGTISLSFNLGLWNGFKSDEKLVFLFGFLNGLFTGQRSATSTSLGACIRTIRYDQAIAMVDKYCRDNPEKWSAPAGDGIISAITVKGGPCEGLSLERLTH